MGKENANQNGAGFCLAVAKWWASLDFNSINQIRWPCCSYYNLSRLICHFSALFTLGIDMRQTTTVPD